MDEKVRLTEENDEPATKRQSALEGHLMKKGFHKDSLLQLKFVIPTILFELFYIVCLLVYFLFSDQHPIGMIGFYIYEILAILIFIPITILTFVLFLRDDVYLIFDLVALVVLLICDCIDTGFTCASDEIIDFQWVVIRFSRSLRVVMFYFRMKSVRWKLKRLVQ